MLRVLLQNRPDARQRPGGDTVLMDATAEQLRAAGHAVQISLELEAALHDIDVVHLFNLTRPLETAAQARHARRHGLPYLLSPIYWDLEAIPWSAYESPRRWRIRFLPEWLRQLAAGGGGGRLRGVQAEIARGARFLFPGSHAEADHLCDRLAPLAADRVRVIRHGVSPPAPPGDESDPPPCDLLCVGAIGPRKNQQGLVRAVRALPGVSLRLLGDTALGCERYRRRVERAAGPRVEFSAAVPHAEVWAFLHRARVLVQASFVETPGLAAMEAAAVGLPLVLANFPPVREIFGDANVHHYCDPAQPGSIADACRAALLQSIRGDAEGFLLRYAWSHTLAPLAAAYAELETELAARA